MGVVRALARRHRLRRSSAGASTARPIRFTLFAGADDVRITIRVDENDLSPAVLATLHEGGHGLYDQGFDPADRDTLLAEAPSMGLHECQARLWENHVGRSRAFWRYVFPRLPHFSPTP